LEITDTGQQGEMVVAVVGQALQLPEEVAVVEEFITSTAPLKQTKTFLTEAPLGIWVDILLELALQQILVLVVMGVADHTLDNSMAPVRQVVEAAAASW
jgi:hypothetical protein